MYGWFLISEMVMRMVNDRIFSYENQGKCRGKSENTAFGGIQGRFTRWGGSGFPEHGADITHPSLHFHSGDKTVVQPAESAGYGIPPQITIDEGPVLN
jgi:hypothetical protein